MASATDYDKGELTDRERKAGENQTTLSKQNVKDVQNQLARQLANYDFADKQNKALRDAQLAQNSHKTSADRFEAQRDLQNSALGLLGSMGSAMNGSTTGNFMRMLENRNDKENSTYWAQHRVNQDAVENSYQDSLNQNRVARRDAMQSAEKAIRDIEREWSANLNNINPNLFKMYQVGGDKSLGSETAWQPDKAKENLAKASGYVQPDMSSGDYPAINVDLVSNRNRMQGGDYFSRLMNRFNGR